MLHIQSINESLNQHNHPKTLSYQFFQFFTIHKSTITPYQSHDQLTHINDPFMRNVSYPHNFISNPHISFQISFYFS